MINFMLIHFLLNRKMRRILADSAEITMLRFLSNSLITSAYLLPYKKDHILILSITIRSSL